MPFRICDPLPPAVTTLLTLCLTVATFSFESNTHARRHEAQLQYPDEVAVLRSIFDNLGGIGWHDNSDWRTNMTDHCAWYGVDCDPEGYVVGLRLYANNLRGELASVRSLGNLSRLASLGLSNNVLIGRFPSSILQLKKLTFLNIADNMLEGPLPSDIFTKLPELSVGLLSRNKFTGTFPPDLSGAKSLDFLDISKNNFSGSLPELVTPSLSALRVLEAQDNQFTGMVPSSLLVHLQTLWIDNNKGLTLPSKLESHSMPLSLRRLTASNGVSFENSSVPEWLVQWAMLSFNSSRDSFPLQCDLREAPYKDPCTNLTLQESSVMTMRCGLCDKKIQPHAAVPPSERQHTCDESDDPSQCAALVSFYNWTQGDAWSDNTGWLSGNSFCTWAGVGCDPQGNIVQLVLFMNNLQGSFPPGEDLSALSNLRFIGLDYNYVGGNALLSIADAQLNALKYIGFTSNKFEGMIPWRRLSCSSPELEDLLLSFNDFHGTLPVDIVDIEPWLDTLKGIELDSNSMEGSIPTTIGNLRSLLYLDLSNNVGLNGSLPESMLQDTKNLLGLDLRNMPNVTGQLTVPLLNSSLRRVTLAGSKNIALSKSLCSWSEDHDSETFHYCDICSLEC